MYNSYLRTGAYCCAAEKNDGNEKLYHTSKRPPQFGGGLLGKFDGGSLRSSIDRMLPFGLDCGDLLLLLVLFFLYAETGDEEFLILLIFIGYHMIKQD